MSPPRRPGPKARRAALVEQLRALIGPLAVYWALLVAMFGAFAIAAMMENPSGESAVILGMFAAVTFGGVAFGQLLALLRVRDWVLFLTWALIWTVGSIFGMVGTAALGAAVAPLMVFLVFAVFLGPIFMMGGAWSLSTGKDLFGTWVPLMYATAATLVLAESSGRVGQWFAGSKWAVWDVFSIGILGTAVLGLVTFLIMRERRRLYLWRRAPRGLLAGSVQESGAVRPSLSLGGWVLVGGLVFGLTLGSALIGPYLWRTGPGGDHDSDHGGEGGDPQDGQDPQDPGKGKGKPRKVESVPDEVARNLQPLGQRQLEEAEAGEPQQGQGGQGGQGGVDLLSTLIIAVILMMLALLVFWRPLRRLMLVRHLRDPLFKVTSTARIENLWLLVEIALGDAGVIARPGEPAQSLVLRAAPTLEKLSSGHVVVHGLLDAAAVRDRVAYGLGLGPDDPARMEQVADDAYETVWSRLGDKGQLRALYRNLG